jgi:hypothetical protein
MISMIFVNLGMLSFYKEEGIRKMPITTLTSSAANVTPLGKRNGRANKSSKGMWDTACCTRVTRLLANCPPNISCNAENQNLCMKFQSTMYTACVEYFIPKHFAIFKHTERSHQNLKITAKCR